jgi:hypothetical protein
VNVEPCPIPWMDNGCAGASVGTGMVGGMGRLSVGRGLRCGEPVMASGVLKGERMGAFRGAFIVVLGGGAVDCGGAVRGAGWDARVPGHGEGIAPWSTGGADAGREPSIDIIVGLSMERGITHSLAAAVAENPGGSRGGPQKVDSGAAHKKRLVENASRDF